MQLRCGTCGHSNEFDQPYAYHAGFGDQGFLYNEAGDSTLVWSIYDPAYEALLSRYAPEQPWELTPEANRDFEAQLPLSPRGDRWRFDNPARCARCKNQIMPPMGKASIYYLLYPDSILLGGGPFERTIETYIEDAANK